MKTKEEIIKELEERKVTLLFHICEDESVWVPEVIASMVTELRQIIKILRILKGE